MTKDLSHLKRRPGLVSTRPSLRKPHYRMVGLVACKICVTFP